MNCSYPYFKCLQSKMYNVPLHFLAATPGRIASETAPHSHYNDPIVATEYGLQGNSRRWGDADFAVQTSIVNTIVSQAQTHGLSLLETAFLLAVARFESGFNPDAAAQSTSASGLGQFIDRTAAAYGLTVENRFNATANVQAMISAFYDLGKKTTKSDSQEEVEARLTMLYGLYHDGPSLAYGGLELARKHVLPWTAKFLWWLQRLWGLSKNGLRS